MKLYLLWWIREPRTWYDKAFGFVVAAACEDDARAFAAGNCGDEGDKPWMSRDVTFCEEIAKRTTQPAGVVLRDFRSA